MSDIWHNPPQTPDVFKSHPIIVVYEAGDQIEQMDSKEYSDLVGERYVNRWCYVDDLLALETENQRLQEKLNETQSLFDKESKDHWHKHKIALKLQEQLSIAIEGLIYMRNNCLDYAADYMDKADDILDQITALEQKDK